LTITVMTWLWSQDQSRAQFHASHVNIWADMVRRHCTLDIRFACVTDTPDGIDPSIAIIAPPGEFVGLETERWSGAKPNCYRRIAMFRPDAADLFGERFVNMDLDLVIGENIDSLLGRGEDFVICEASRAGNKWVYNGSMVLMTAGSRSKVYEEFTAAGAELSSRRYVGSDQAWIAYVLGPDEATWGPADGVVRWGAAKQGKIMFFPGLPKPWDVVRENMSPWVAAHYRAAPRGRAIYLGYGMSVWDDAKAVMAAPYAGLIASPEAAKHWPGPIDAVARDDAEAVRLAGMMGFDELVHCGRAERKTG
jgi:hypothetical protein